MTTVTIDAETKNAAQVFIGRLAGRYDLAAVLLFGSRARHTHRADSDADIAFILRGQRERIFDTVRTMSGIAFDVMLETGFLIQPMPLLEDDWLHPERFDNPDLVDNIRRDGVHL